MADLVGIVENLLMLGEEMIVMWANNNLRFPQFSCVAWVPEERRDRNKPIQFVVTASPNSSEICRVAGPPEEPVRERARGVAGVNCGPWKHRLCVHAITRSFVATITHGNVVQFAPVSSSVLNKWAALKRLLKSSEEYRIAFLKQEAATLSA
jgi:hypothetical protein